MKRLLLLALPALLAGCPKPQPATDAAPPATTTPAATAGEAPGKTEFAQVAMIRAAATLPKHHWRLTDATDAKGQRIEALFAREAQPVTLDCKDGRLNVGNTCNRMGGTFSVGGRELTVGKLASTMMACTDPKLMALDAEVDKRLQGKLGLRMSKGDAPPQLELKTATGDVLVFDEKGLKVGTPGAFGNFYATIEGYTHQPGVRNVLRVDRYEIKNPPADAPSQAYVLDMVVESDASAKP